MLYRMRITTVEEVEVELKDDQEAKDVATNIARLRQNDASPGQEVSVEFETPGCGQPFFVRGKHASR